MGLPHPPSTHQYPPSLQLKLYQAFIFSVPILFTIILFLLFYLCYLKRRRPSSLSSQELLPTSLSQATTVLSLPFDVGLEKEFKDELPVILFNEEDSTARDTQCSVCLGDFEVKQRLHQLPSCKHLFHVDCIRHWLVTSATCPLCRTSIIPVKNPSLPRSLVIPSPALTDAAGTNVDQARHQEQEESRIEELSHTSAEHSGALEGSSSGRPCLRPEYHHSFVAPPPNSLAAVQIQIHSVREQVIL
ncbi:probable E3 ubiquitin-protein ligase RHA4A [Aristolochia californica]|uniref:probable E3 ubiquitin-protein ligase RHA4A n=1 Tax=Aristolochia californica TaxID=171875 RepID=UPI0035DBC118